MPYSSNSELPSNVRNPLPEAAQTIFRRVFNTADKKYDETRARKIAWAAVKNAGFKKGSDGKWSRESVFTKAKPWGSSSRDGITLFEARIDKTLTILPLDIDLVEVSKPYILVDIEEQDQRYRLQLMVLDEYMWQLENEGRIILNIKESSE